MNILSVDMPSRWLLGATLEWVTSVSDERSDGGTFSPVPRQTRPLMQFSFDVFYGDVVTHENLFIQCNGPANGFFCKPPIARYYQVVGRTLGIATGSAQTFTLTITRGQTWNLLYIDTAATTVYANGVALSGGAWSITLGVLTVTATAGQTITIDFEYKTPFKYVIQSMAIELQSTFEMPQHLVIQEIP